MTRLAMSGAVVAGLALGALGHAALSGSRAPAPNDRAARTAAPGVACARSIGPADLAALRDELTRRIDERLASPPGAPAPPPAKAPDEPRPEAVAAVATAHEVIDAAVARGTWLDADRQSFHTALIAMDERNAAL